MTSYSRKSMMMCVELGYYFIVGPRKVIFCHEQFILFLESSFGPYQLALREDEQT